MPRYLLFSIVLTIYLAPTARADFAVGLEYSQVNRNLGSVDLDSDQAGEYSVSLAFDLTNSLFQMKFADEESDFDFLGTRQLERQEASIAWHWNETLSKNRFFGVGVGFFHVDYDVLGFGSDSFLGAKLGLSFTSYIPSTPLFFAGQAWLKAPFIDESDELESDKEGNFIVGHEVQLGIGASFGDSTNVSIMLGYRDQQIDYEDAFLIHDDREDFFLTLRIFVDTGK